jgi:sortase A
MTAENGRKRRRRIDRALMALGLACLIAYATVSVQTALYQRKAKAEVEAMISAHQESAESAPPLFAAAASSAAIVPLAPGELIGRVDIPRIKLSAAIAEGEDASTLDVAVGHLPDTPLPWHQRGNVAVAAHRDGLFRPLKNVRLDDDVRIVTERGEYHYKVRKTHIVNPDDVWVLAPTPTPSLTLITCYPFSYVGNAPKRFIVQAELVGLVAGSVLKGSVVR